LKVASWNVNSIKARLEIVRTWIESAAPDILLLQELKCTEADFPAAAFAAQGYTAAVVGQKTYNGVAILSKWPITGVVRLLPGDGEDSHARYVEAQTAGIRVASIYVPNGQTVGSDAFSYKLAFLDRLRSHAARLLKGEEAFVLGGDYNIAPDDGDVYDPDGWRDGVLFTLTERQAFRRLIHLGLVDAYRTLHGEIGRYTWWDYRAGAWSKDHGLRIDHLLLSPQAADRLEACDIDRKPRGREKTSDHAPIWCTFKAPEVLEAPSHRRRSRAHDGAVIRAIHSPP